MQDELLRLSSDGASVNQLIRNASTMDVVPLLLALMIGSALAFAVSWHYLRFASTLSNRAEFIRVFPLILLTVLLIISVVKSSLALSLGLVGALSVVRFRTPIKEPEELAYLFLVIAVGIGLGAGQLIGTVMATSYILLVVAILRRKKALRSERGLFLSIVSRGLKERPGNVLAEFELVVVRHASRCELRRYDENDEEVEALFYIDIDSSTQLASIIKDLRAKFAGTEISFLDQKNISGF